MKNPGFENKAVWLGWVALIALTGALLAQPPESSSKKAPVPRTKPQVIYHLPRSSNYAATLHSQAKGQNNELPVGAGLPTSPSTSHSNANAAAAEAQEAAALRLKESSVKQPKVQSKRSFRGHAPARPKEQKNSHGNTHKK